MKHKPRVLASPINALCHDELPVEGGDEIAPELNAQALKDAFRVVSTDKAPQFSPVEEWHNVDIHWQSNAMVGTNGFELIPDSYASDYAFQVLKGVEVNKHPYGACYHDFAEKESTGVIEFFRQKQITRVLVGGLATNYCGKTTVLQLRRAGFEEVVSLGDYHVDSKRLRGKKRFKKRPRRAPPVWTIHPKPRKMKVYELFKYLNTMYRKPWKECIQKAVLDKEPSIELRPGQRGQDSLPPYPVLGAMLRAYVEPTLLSTEQRLADKKLSEQAATEMIQWVLKLVDKVELKRRQATPIIRMHGKSFGHGRQAPIVHKLTTEVR